MRVIKLLLPAAALASLALAATPPAHATLQIAISAGATTFFCADNSGACDTNPAIGTIQLANQVIGGIQVNGSIQTSVGTLSNPGPLDILNASSLSLINVSGASVTTTTAISDTDFVGPANGFVTSGSGVWQTAGGSTITLNWFNDPTNTQGADNATDTPGTLIDTFTSTAVGNADSFSHNNSGPASDPGLFSMTEQVTGTLVAGGQLLNRGQTEIKTPTAAPEPASLAILGLGLLGLAGIRRRGG